MVRVRVRKRHKILFYIATIILSVHRIIIKGFFCILVLFKVNLTT
jgi:hypothetical protein